MENKTGAVKIKVIGVGGGGNNAVNHMISEGVNSAEFIAANTDLQALNMSKATVKLQLGPTICNGLGAGSDPDIGRQAAEESIDKIEEAISDANLLFITAGMGGGTGTGAAPVVARIAKELGILTIAFVTKPFTSFEGKIRMEQACKGIVELHKYVDSVLIIPNERISAFVKKGTPFKKAFEVADDILRYAIKGIADIITIPSLINLDFSDIKKVMKNAGNSHIGIGRSRGERRMVEAVKQAALSPLIETSLLGATGIILYVAASEDSLTLEEVTSAAALVQKMAAPECRIIFGAGFDQNLADDVTVTIIATGFNNTVAPQRGAFANPTVTPEEKPVGEEKQEPSATPAVERPQQPVVDRPVLVTPNNEIPSPRMMPIDTTEPPKFVTLMRDKEGKN